eukprot:11784939-Alexandrium_andersonii.AAC.1
MVTSWPSSSSGSGSPAEDHWSKKKASTLERELLVFVACILPKRLSTGAVLLPLRRWETKRWR